MMNSEIRQHNPKYSNCHELVLAVGILYLASNMTFRQIGDCFGISKSTARKYFRIAMDAIIEVFQTGVSDPVIRYCCVECYVPRAAYVHHLT